MKFKDIKSVVMKPLVVGVVIGTLKLFKSWVNYNEGKLYPKGTVYIPICQHTAPEHLMGMEFNVVTYQHNAFMVSYETMQAAESRIKNVL